MRVGNKSKESSHRCVFYSTEKNLKRFVPDDVAIGYSTDTQKVMVFDNNHGWVYPKNTIHDGHIFPSQLVNLEGNTGFYKTLSSDSKLYIEQYDRNKIYFSPVPIKEKCVLRRITFNILNNSLHTFLFSLYRSNDGIPGKSIFQTNGSPVDGKLAFNTTIELSPGVYWTAILGRGNFMSLGTCCPHLCYNSENEMMYNMIYVSNYVWERLPPEMPKEHLEAKFGYSPTAYLEV